MRGHLDRLRSLTQRLEDYETGYQLREKALISAISAMPGYIAVITMRGEIVANSANTELWGEITDEARVAGPDGWGDFFDIRDPVTMERLTVDQMPGARALAGEASERDVFVGRTGKAGYLRAYPIYHDGGQVGAIVYTGTGTLADSRKNCGQRLCPFAASPGVDGGSGG